MGRKYKWLDQRTLLSDHQKQEVSAFGITLRRTL